MIKMTTGALRSIFVAMSVAAAAVPRRGYPRRPLDLDRLELPLRLRGRYSCFTGNGRLHPLGGDP